MKELINKKKKGKMEKDNSLIGITVRNSLISLSFVLLLINVGGRPVLGTFGC